MVTFSEVSWEAETLDREMRSRDCQACHAVPPTVAAAATVVDLEKWKETMRAELRHEMKEQMTALMETLVREVRQNGDEGGGTAARGSREDQTGGRSSRTTLISMSSRRGSARVSGLVARPGKMPIRRRGDGGENGTGWPCEIESSAEECWMRLRTPGGGRSWCPAHLHRSKENPLELITYPRVSTDLADGLGAPISTAETQEAIRLLQNGKSPGPDGYIVEFYKAYSDQISPPLTKLYNKSFSNGRLPPTLSEATY
ncbi:hypothetical protein NHX12_002058 [Muraenolepis orangiensis]|uniref:Reverse transcriptase n=1 Tax=Muraenolepis orangiensis TaxID=630683 RepID=A0A9Q0DZR1_9TELE|nr:hypothetical protein NHX12_002058 [Muraenolepis orangiensis]